MKRAPKHLLVIVAALALVFAACGDDDTDTTAGEDDTTEETDQAEPQDSNLPTDACDSAFAAAAAVGDMEDTVEDLYPAARQCESLADWIAADEANPDALDGADPETFARNVCQYGENMDGSSLCAEVLG